MVRENMRSPRAVLHSSIFCEFLLQGGTLLGSTPRLAQSGVGHASLSIK